MPYANRVPEPEQHYPKKQHSLLHALESIDTGSLELHLPGNIKYTYKGVKPGTDAQLKFHEWECLDRLVNQGDLAWGEDYMRGLWETDNLATLMQFVAENHDVLKDFSNGNVLFRFWQRMQRAVNNNQPLRSRENVQKHYNLGNNFYRLWLDEGMAYSCGLFNGNPVLSLEEAQKAKYTRILDKLAPLPGSHILDIGCGWGGFMEMAAVRGCKVTGVTLSREQYDFTKNRLAATGLGDRAEVRLQDYRDLTGTFDHIVSIGMFEHVGEAFWSTYMNSLRTHLKKGGTALVETITMRDGLFAEHRDSSGFIREHIFPGGLLPSRQIFEHAALEADLTPLDIFLFGQDYAITLHKWLERFDAHEKEVRCLGYDESFIRKWRFYLTYCAAMFKSGHINVMQAHLYRNTN